MLIVFLIFSESHLFARLAFTAHIVVKRIFAINCKAGVFFFLLLAIRCFENNSVLVSDLAFLDCVLVARSFLHAALQLPFKRGGKSSRGCAQATLLIDI